MEQKEAERALMENITEHKRIERDNRQMAILPKHRDGDILIPFHKREMMPMKSCPDCKQTGILTINGLFGCPKCRHYFK